MLGSGELPRAVEAFVLGPEAGKGGCEDVVVVVLSPE